MKALTMTEVKGATAATQLVAADPETLQWETQQIELALARRAYELFEARGCEHGHDWEDWFQAQSELLRPVSIAMSESADRISIRANIPGFSDSELKIGIAPKDITIVGTKPTEISSEPELASNPSCVLHHIALTSAIDPERAVAELESGVLKLELPKVAITGAKAARAGKD